MIRSFWHGRELGPYELLSIKSILGHGHKFELLTYADGASAAVPSWVPRRDANEIVPADQVIVARSGVGSPSLHSNYFRYEALRQLGGWWLDLDVLVLARDLPSTNLFIAGDAGGSIITAAMKFPQGHPLLLQASDLCHEPPRETSYGHRTDPKLMSALVRHYHLSELVWPASEVFAVDAEDIAGLFDPACREDIERRTTGFAFMRLFNEFRRASGFPASAGPPEDSFLDAMFKRFGADICFGHRLEVEHIRRWCANKTDSDKFRAQARRAEVRLPAEGAGADFGGGTRLVSPKRGQSPHIASEVRGTVNKKHQPSRREQRRETRKQRIAYACMTAAGPVMNFLPHRLVFKFLVVIDALKLPLQNVFAAAYRPYAISRTTIDPTLTFSKPLAKRLIRSSVRILYSIGAYGEACRLAVASGQTVVHPEINYIQAASLFELSEFAAAREAVGLLADIRSSTRHQELKAALDLIAGDVGHALQSFERACHSAPHLRQPHQNLAAGFEREYAPNPIDEAVGRAGQLFDLANYVGQRVTHVGRGDVGIELYARALSGQRDLRQRPLPAISAELARTLAHLGIRLAELRIIPIEWTTQIGHLGMLDILMRMKTLGWWDGKPVLVLDPNKIANASFLRLFESCFPVLTIGKDIPEETGRELLSLQRWFGLSFNAFRFSDGTVVPWQDAGARAIRQWETESRSLPLRDEFDALFETSGYVHDSMTAMKKDWGMKQDDWYVCLHVRDPSHYLELPGYGQAHRNAALDTYLSAVRYITQRGGWVIKLGGPSSQALPSMKQVVDYSRSRYKSELVDLHLIRHAKFFIGTTSGLTNVAISFGVPCALVNCITTDAQIWNGNVRFALKQVLTSSGALNQRQITSEPWRWRCFDAGVLSRHGARPVGNSSDEILETVREVEAIAKGNSDSYEVPFEADRRLSLWRAQLSTPHYYGNARPSLYYLMKHEAEFLAERRDANEKLEDECFASSTSHDTLGGPMVTTGTAP